MSQQTIGIGTIADDGTGDTLRTAGGKLNSNFTELYAAVAALPTTYQPLDADLTAIAALATTSYGRSVLTQADAAALRSLAGLVIGTSGANVPLLNAGNTWSGTPIAFIDAGNGATYSAVDPVNGGKQFIQLAFNSAIRGIGRDEATSYHLLRVADVFSIDGGTHNFALLGDSRLDWLSVACKLDLVGNDIIDVTNVGNVLGLYSTRLIQGIADATYDVGIKTTDGSGALTDRLTFSNHVATSIARFSASKIVVGAATPGSNLLTFGNTAGQTSAQLAARFPGNSIEFGHDNGSGYGSTLGAEASSGSPFMAFNAEAGTSADTYRTRGIAGTVVKSDLAGGLLVGKIPTASANNQAFSELMHITATARIGLGGNAPNSQFDAYATSGGTFRASSNSAASYGEFIFSSNNASYLGYGASIEGTGNGAGIDVGDLRFKTGNGGVRTTRVYISPGGNVGIGTTSPLSLLSVGDVGYSGRAITAAANAAAPIITLRQDHASGYGLQMFTGGTWGGDPLYITDANGILFKVAPNGNVGVGTTSPVCALDANGPVRVKSYTVGTVPAANAGAGQSIYVTDETGGATGAESDGTNWRRYSDRAIIS